jgi:hypothetical protein
MTNLNVELDDETYGLFLREKLRLSMAAKKNLTWDETLKEIAKILPK